jgi:hypothetical protein
LRPAVIFDHVEDAAIYGLNVQGNPQAESVLRFIDSKQALLTGSRVLTPQGRSCNSKAKATTGSSSRGEIVESRHRQSHSRTAHRSNPSSCAM